MAKMNEQQKSVSAIQKLRASIRAKMSSTRDDIQRAAVMIIMHAVKFGDITEADRLCDDIKQAKGRNAALGEWFVNKGIAKVRTSKIDGKEVKHFAVDEGKRKALAERIATDGEVKVSSELMTLKWDAKVQTEDTYDGFNLEAKLRSLVKAAERNLEKHGDHPKTKIDRDMLIAIKRAYLSGNPVVAAKIEAPAARDGEAIASLEGWTEIEPGYVAN